MPFDPLPKVNLEDAIKPAGEAARAFSRTFLITGPTGGGKTTSVTTIPDNEKGLLMDFDGKSHIVTALAPKKIDIINLKFDRNEYKNQAALIEALHSQAIELGKTYQWCFVDGLTNLYSLAAMLSHDNVNGKNRTKITFDKMDWIDGWIWERLHRLSAAFQNLVLYAHEDYRESESGMARVLPLCRKALSASMPGNFQEVYHATTAGLGDDITHFWLTKAEETYGNTSSIMELPHKVPNNFDLVTTTDWTSVKNVGDAITKWEGKTKKKITRWS